MGQREHSLNDVWDVGTLAWARMTQPVISTDTLTVSLAGVATAANQTTGNTSLSSIDTKTPALVSGRQPVDGSGVTQPVSGTFWQATQPISGTVTLAAGTNTNEVVGDAASGVAKAGNPVQVGAVFNTTQPTVTSGQVVEAQATARGGQIVATGIDTFNVTVNAALPAGTANIGDVDIASIAAGDNNIGNVDVVTLPALVAGTANIGDVDILSIAAGDNNIGNVDIVTMPSVTIGTFPDNEPFNVAQFGGTAVVTGTGAGGLGIPRVTISNDSSLAANQSINLNQWGGTGTTLGQKAMTASVPVVMASDQAAVPVLQSGTWTAQPGNTANTTAWLVDGRAGKTLKSASFSLTATGTAVSAVVGKKIKVYAYKLVCSAALTVNWRDGASTALEGGQAFATNGGAVENVNPPAFLFATTAGNALDLVISGTGTAAGRVSYYDDDAS